jgi:hypothetical protein
MALDNNPLLRALRSSDNTQNVEIEAYKEFAKDHEISFNDLIQYELLKVLEEINSKMI